MIYLQNLDFNYKALFLGLLLFTLSACTSVKTNKDISCEETNTCNEFSSIDDLNKSSISCFIVMSDNKGDAIEDERFKNMVDWRKKFNADFIIVVVEVNFHRNLILNSYSN